MSVMFELLYPPPTNQRKESVLLKQIAEYGGRLDYREEGDQTGRGAICLTFEFDDWEKARHAAEALRQQGEHVEGPSDYGA